MLDGVKFPCQEHVLAKTNKGNNRYTDVKNASFHNKVTRESFRKLTASIPNLYTGLANVNRNDFAHFSF